LSSQAHELEPAGLEDETRWQRWCYLISEFRRYASTEAQLWRAIFGERDRQPAFDIAAAFAADVAAENNQP
jgi:hypothetical protein